MIWRRARIGAGWPDQIGSDCPPGHQGSPLPGLPLALRAGTRTPWSTDSFPGRCQVGIETLKLFSSAPHFQGPLARVRRA